MSIARFQSLAHWGAFTALVEDGRLIGCEPFSRDPAPSDMLAAMPDMVHSPLRIARPAIREGWREGRPRTGADGFHEVSWDEALDTVAGELKRVRATHGDKAIFGGSYGWASAGRVHHARSLVRRFLFLGGGCVDQVANYSFGADLDANAAVNDADRQLLAYNYGFTADSAVLTFPNFFAPGAGTVWNPSLGGGGSGGSSDGGVAGAAGGAVASLTLDDSVAATKSSTVSGNVNATGGAGGSGT